MVRWRRQAGASRPPALCLGAQDQRETLGAAGCGSRKTASGTHHFTAKLQRTRAMRLVRCKADRLRQRKEWLHDGTANAKGYRYDRDKNRRQGCERFLRAEGRLTMVTHYSRFSICDFRYAKSSNNASPCVNASPIGTIQWQLGTAESDTRSDRAQRADLVALAEQHTTRAARALKGAVGQTRAVVMIGFTNVGNDGEGFSLPAVPPKARGCHRFLRWWCSRA